MRFSPDESATSGRDAYTEFGKYGEVRRPEDAEAPILGPSTRQVLHQWMYELNYAEALAEVGVKPRQRALLKGPPGTGKTTLAWHIAGRLGVPMVVVETPSLISKYIGQTGEQIGDLFRRARKYKGAIALFFDEIDALAAARGGATSSGETEKNNIVIALLQMVDRHDGLIFAATNKPDVIDPAIWRRFQMQIEVGLPGAAERFAIVKRYAAPFRADDDTVQEIAEALIGAAPALIREVIESVKRDLVLGPHLGHNLSPRAVFQRIRAATSPAPGMPIPPLWHEDTADQTLATLAAMSAWPPTLELETA